MNLGYVILMLVWCFFFLAGFWGGFSDIWTFGVILLAATIAILIRNYYLSKK